MNSSAATLPSECPSIRQWQRIGLRPHHGIAIPLFSLHSNNSCGIGEYPDLLPLLDWCQLLGIDTIQLLPLNDTGEDTSPYSAVSAFALNPFHLGLTSLPFINEYPSLISALEKIPKGSTSLRVDYPTMRIQKESFLKEYYETVKKNIIKSAAYKEFIARSPWLQGYALFKILKKRFNNYTWESWPQEWKTPDKNILDTLEHDEADAVQWHFVVQYLCDLQLHHVKVEAEKRGVFLMGDIPILISRDSADVWLNRDLFLLNYSAGAPPDMYSEEGQDWGCPIYNWQTMESQGYRWWVNRLQTASRYYQIYRLDHIVGFFRIWSIPTGMKSRDGHFIPTDPSSWIKHGRNILEMMLKECDMLPIGEDLGIVPPEVRVTLQQLGICGTKVMRWERRWDLDGLFVQPQDYPLLGLTTVSTHDSETQKLWWRDHPIESHLYASSRGWEFQPDLTETYHEYVLRDSHQSTSIFHINLLQEYLTLVPELAWIELENDRINVPGTISETNWSYRFKPSVEEIVANPVLLKAMKSIIKP